MLSKIRNTFLASVIALTGTVPVHASAIQGRDGQIFYRYKDVVVVAADPDTVAKDVVAYFIGGVGFPLSELLPLKTEWQDDLWSVEEGTLPDGITFNSATRTFEGTPTSAAKGTVVYLRGVDKNGYAVADAKITFDVYDIVGQPVKADLYAHTGKYKLDELAIPSGLTVDSWERIAQYAPPPGVTVNGPYFEGTPTTAGQWNYMIYGKNYMGEIVVTFWGKYVVEEGPTFPQIADMVYKLPQVDRGQWLKYDFGAPSPYKINRPIDATKQVRYFLEVDPTSSLPGSVVSNDQSKDLRIKGDVVEPYDTGRVRFRAVDSDDTVGYSNWFTFGSSDPQPSCVAGGNAYPFVLYTGTSASVQIPPPQGGQGLLEYHISAGTLPGGLTLGKDTGIIGGTPTTAGDNQTVTVRVDVVNGQNTVSTECAYNIVVKAGNLSVADATDPQAKHVRTGGVYNGLARISGGIPTYDLTFTDPSAFPTIGFTSATQNSADVTVSGVIPTAGPHSIGLTLSNGDGTTQTGSLGVIAHDELAVGVVPTIHIKRLAKAQDWATVPYDAATVIPDVRLGDQPKFALTGTLPSDITFEDGTFSGATSAAAKSYGMFTATISDYSGDTKPTQPFEIVVDPRDKILAGTPDEPRFSVEWSENQTATPVTFTQPEGATNFTVEYELVNLSGDAVPAWLSVNKDTGVMTALAGIPYAEKGKYGPYAIKATDQEGSTDTSDPFEVEIADWMPPSANVLSSWQGTVSGNTAIGEDATWLDIPGAKASTLSNYIDPTTVIGGRAGVTYTGSSPSSPAGIGAISAAGVFSGRPTEEFKGNIEVNFKDAKNRVGTMLLPLEVRPYPAVVMDQAEYELPRLARAETLGIKIQGKPGNGGFWNAPVWTIDTVKGNPLPSHPDDAPSDKLYVDPASGMIRGFTKAAVGTRVDNIILKATSTGANAGERFESWTAPFSIVITKPADITLSYDKNRVIYYLVDDGKGGLTMSGTNPTISPVATISGSYEAPETYTLNTADAVANGMTGTLGINPNNGNLVGFPNVLGEWTVLANVSDKNGLANTPADVPLTIKATLDGYVQYRNVISGGTVKLRQDQKFETAVLDTHNAVGDVVFTPTPANLTAGLDFDALTGRFRPASHFGTPLSGYGVRIDAKDDDGRDFAPGGHPEYRFDVIAPLTASAALSDLTATQYAAPGSGDINATFGMTTDNEIGRISYALEGDVPGTLVNRVYDENGNFVSWNWKDENGADQSLPASTVNPEPLLPVDALVFDTKNPSLKGSPSKAGVFAGLTIKATDSHINAYEVDKAGLDVSANRIAYNTATVGPFSITVEPAAALAVANSAASETLYQYTSTPTIRTSTQNAAYGRAVTWTQVSGDLPEGITANKADAVTYSGYAEEKGTFGNIVWRARDAAGRSATATAVSFTVEERKGLELAANPNPFGVVEGTELPPFSVSPRNAAYGKAIPAENWTLPASGLPSGLDMAVANGRVGLEGTTSAVGDYSVAVSAVDSLGAPANTTVAISVLDEDELIEVSSAKAKTKKDVPAEVQVTPTSRTFGTVTYASADPDVTVNNSGVAKATYSAAGDYTATVTVSDSTRRSTDHEIAVEVMDELEVIAPETVYAEIGKSRSASVAVNNVLGAASFEKGAGTWPAGLDVDPATGAITGVVTAAKGEYAGLTVRGTDTFVSGGNTYTETRDSNSFTVLVDGKPTGFELATPVSPDTIAALVVNTAIEDFAITPVNAAWDRPIPAGNWTVDISLGLPPGVQVAIQNDRVVLTGTPTLTGAFGPIHVTATDGLGQQATTQLTLRVIEPTDEIVLTLPETVTTKVDVPFSVQAAATNTYGRVHFYSYDIDGDPKTKVPGQYVNELDIDINTGKVTGAFPTLGDRDLDVWVTDATKRLTSRPLTVSVIPNLRVTVPTQVAAQQGVILNRAVDTAYKLGTVAYRKGLGDWPEGIDVNPTTGAMFSRFVDPVTGAVSTRVVAEAKTYPGLTIVAEDTFVVDGVTYTDRQSSNAFAIVVDPADVVPDIADQQKTILGTQDTAIAAWYPKAASGWAKGVIETGEPTLAWNYAGTKYKLSHDLTQYGLSFDENTGIVSGTAHTPFIVRDMVMTVTSARGDSDSTAPFWIGVAPKGPITLSSTAKTLYKIRRGDPWAPQALIWDNVIGNLTHTKTSGHAVFSVDVSTGVVTSTTATSTWGISDWPVGIRLTDEFNRTADAVTTISVKLELVLATAEKGVAPRQTFTNSSVATVTPTGIYGALSYVMTGLPDGLSYNGQTGLVSGTLDAKYKNGDVIPVTVTITDSYDGAVRTSTFNYRVKDGYMYYRLNDSVTPDGNTWGGVYWGEMKLRNAAGVDLASGGIANSAVDALISSPNVYPQTSASNPPRVFDGQTVTGMLFGRDGLGVRYIGVKFKEPQVITSAWISLPKPTSQADFDWLNTYYPAVPVNFKIEASNDGVNWTTLKTDSFTGVGGGSQRTQWDATYTF